MALPPSAVTLPPSVALVLAMVMGAAVVTVAAVATGWPTVAEAEVVQPLASVTVTV